MKTLLLRKKERKKEEESGYFSVKRILKDFLVKLKLTDEISNNEPRISAPSFCHLYRQIVGGASFNRRGRNKQF